MNRLKTSVLFKLVFANNTILSCFFIFFLIIDLYLVITQIFNPVAQLVIPMGIPTKESKAKMEIHPVNVEAKIRKCASCSSAHFTLFL